MTAGVTRRGQCTAVVLVAGLLAALASPASAQWIVSGSWGASEDVETSTPGTVQSFQLGVHGFTDAARLTLIGGLPARPSEDLTWGLAEVSSMPFLAGSGFRGVGLQTDLLASGFAYHDPVSELDGAGGQLAVEPHFTYSGETFRVRVGGGVRTAGTRVAGLSSGETSGVIGGDLRIGAAGPLSARVRTEAMLLGDRTLPYGAVGLLFDHDHGYAWAGVDRWQGDEPATGWYAGGSLDLTDALSARVNFGRTSGDPLFDTPPRRTWSVGVRYRFAERPGASRLTSLPEFDSGTVHLRIPAAGVRGRVSVGGSFNGWQPMPMTRDGDEWTITLELEPGYYEIAFADEAGRWFVPESLPGRRPDGMGGWVLTLVVS